MDPGSPEGCCTAALSNLEARPLPSSQRFESKKVTELASHMVWKRWVGCRQDAGRASSDCGTGAPEGFGKGRSLPDRGCHRDEDSVAVVQLLLCWRHYQPFPAGCRGMQRQQAVP